MYRRAGLLSQSEEAAAYAAAAATGSSGTTSCLVCMSDVPTTQATAMDCGHIFCNECWREHMRWVLRRARAG